MLGMNNLGDRISIWLATGLGIGMVSPAPGTVGGLWGLPLAWAIGMLPTVGDQVVALVIIGLVSVAVCSRAASVFGGKDPQVIVLDEIAALPIVYLGVSEKTTVTWLIGWVLFRVFDITKPPPARQLERLPAGWGIVADDVVAAVFACVALHGVLWAMGLF